MVNVLVDVGQKSELHWLVAFVLVMADDTAHSMNVRSAVESGRTNA
jgi:hypothetical protein